MTHLGPRPPIYGVGILAGKYENPMCIVLWQVGALFPCFLGPEIDWNHQFCDKTIIRPIVWPRPFSSVGILAGKYKNPMCMLLWQMGTLFLRVLGQGIDWNHSFYPKTVIKHFLWPNPFGVPVNFVWVCVTCVYGSASGGFFLMIFGASNRLEPFILAQRGWVWP